MSCCAAIPSVRPEPVEGPAPVARLPVRTELVEVQRSAQLDTTGMTPIPGGPFLMGSDSADTFIDDAEGPVREVHLPRYLIDTTAVPTALNSRTLGPHVWLFSSMTTPTIPCAPSACASTCMRSIASSRAS